MDRIARSNPIMLGGLLLVVSAVIFVVALGLWLYARAMAEKGVLV